LKLNFVHQFLVYAQDVNFLGTGYILYRKNTQASVDISKEDSQTVSADGTKCVYMSCEQNAGQNYILKIGNKYCENVVKFRYWGTNVMNQNLYLCRN
jgi:hypothetical protein